LSHRSTLIIWGGESSQVSIIQKIRRSEETFLCLELHSLLYFNQLKIVRFTYNHPFIPLSMIKSRTMAMRNTKVANAESLPILALNKSELNAERLSPFLNP
jgi:hypothetical protein